MSSRCSLKMDKGYSDDSFQSFRLDAEDTVCSQCAHLRASHCMKIKIVNWSLIPAGLILSYKEHNGRHFKIPPVFSGDSTHHYEAPGFQTQ